MYANKLNNLDEMEKFLETKNLPRLNHEEIENLDRLIISKESESVMNILPTKKSLGPHSFLSECYKTFKEELKPVLLKLFQKTEANRTYFMWPELP